MPKNPQGIGGLASSRRPLLLRSDLLAADHTDKEVAALVARGVASRPQQGITMLSAADLTWEDELAAAVFATPGAAASHTSAGRLFKLDGVRTSRIEITIPYESGGRPRGAKVHRTRRTKRLAVVNGIPVTAVEETLLDLATVLSRLDLAKALASALTRGLTTISAIRVLLSTTGRGCAGVGRLRAAADRYGDGSPPPGSAGEAAFFEFLVVEGIEIPERQMEVIRPDGSKAYVDFGWRARWKGLEFDGLGSRADSRSHDAELVRQNDLFELGLELRRYSPVALAERPREVYSSIVRFLRRPNPLAPGVDRPAAAGDV